MGVKFDLVYGATFDALRQTRAAARDVGNDRFGMVMAHARECDVAVLTLMVDVGARAPRRN